MDKSSGNGIRSYFTQIRDLQQQIIEQQTSTLCQIADQMAETISVKGRIFLFGSGHSHMMAEEAFYRAGGLAAAVPIFSSALMLHENTALSSRLERTPGIANLIFAPYKPNAGEMIFIFSNSGVNQLPVELALLAKALGLKVVAICALQYATRAPLSAIGKRLAEVADYVLDNGGVAGDALVEVPQTPWRVAPSSTITCALLWNCLLTETVFRLQALGFDLPLIASLNMPGAAEHNEIVMEQWRKVNPHL